MDSGTKWKVGPVPVLKPILVVKTQPLELNVELDEWTPKYTLDNAETAVKLKPGDNEIVHAKPNELQLDYDADELPEQFNKLLPILRDRFAKGNIEWKKYHSSSGKHLHVVITLPEEITDQERIVWQAVFGSDYMREGLNVLRMVAHIENPSLLFMPKNREVLDSGVILPKPGRRFKELV